MANACPATSPAKQLRVFWSSFHWKLRKLCYLSLALRHLHAAHVECMSAHCQPLNVTSCACHRLQVPPVISTTAFAAFTLKYAADYAARDANWRAVAEGQVADNQRLSHILGFLRSPQGNELRGQGNSSYRQEEDELSASSARTSCSESDWSNQPLCETVASEQLRQRPCRIHSLLRSLRTSKIVMTWLPSYSPGRVRLL